ncbi:hypothetical protein [Burkholderia contaminans]|uniref:hypothetical protein n=1 Tax=Burkholderia contaminans TaxID=488447 RepID=UPI001588DD3A|nr:hypothetical protein [Burkholderia contaminans]
MANVSEVEAINSLISFLVGGATNEADAAANLATIQSSKSDSTDKLISSIGASADILGTGASGWQMLQQFATSSNDAGAAAGTVAGLSSLTVLAANVGSAWKTIFFDNKDQIARGDWGAAIGQVKAGQLDEIAGAALAVVAVSAASEVVIPLVVLSAALTAAGWEQSPGSQTTLSNALQSLKGVIQPIYDKLSTTDQQTFQSSLTNGMQQLLSGGMIVPQINANGQINGYQIESPTSSVAQSDGSTLYTFASGVTCQCGVPIQAGPLKDPSANAENIWTFPSGSTSDATNSYNYQTSITTFDDGSYYENLTKSQSATQGPFSGNKVDDSVALVYVNAPNSTISAPNSVSTIIVAGKNGVVNNDSGTSSSDPYHYIEGDDLTVNSGSGTYIFTGKNDVANIDNGDIHVQNGGVVTVDGSGNQISLQWGGSATVNATESNEISVDEFKNPFSISSNGISGQAFGDGIVVSGTQFTFGLDANSILTVASTDGNGLLSDKLIFDNLTGWIKQDQHYENGVISSITNYNSDPTSGVYEPGRKIDVVSFDSTGKEIGDTPLGGDTPLPYLLYTDPSGKPAVQVDFSNGVEVDRKIFTDGQLTSETFYAVGDRKQTETDEFVAGSTIPNSRTFQDSAEQITSIETLDSTGNLVSREFYNSIGNITEKDNFTPGTSNISEKNYFDPNTGIEQSRGNYDATGALISTDIWNASGKEAERDVYSLGSVLPGSRIYFDPISQKATFASNYNSAGEIVSNDVYAANGRIIEETSYVPGTSNITTASFYDENGNGIATETFNPQTGELVAKAEFNPGDRYASVKCHYENGFLIQRNHFDPQTGVEKIQENFTPGNEYPDSQSTFFSDKQEAIRDILDPTTGKRTAEWQFEDGHKYANRVVYFDGNGNVTDWKNFNPDTGIEPTPGHLWTPAEIQGFNAPPVVNIPPPPPPPTMTTFPNGGVYVPVGTTLGSNGQTMPVIGAPLLPDNPLRKLGDSGSSSSPGYGGEGTGSTGSWNPEEPIPSEITCPPGVVCVLIEGTGTPPSSNNDASGAVSADLLANLQVEQLVQAMATFVGTPAAITALGLSQDQTAPKQILAASSHV